MQGVLCAGLFLAGFFAHSGIAQELPVEQQLELKAQFLDDKICQTLIDYYRKEKTSLYVHSDNQISLGEISSESIRNLIVDISEDIRIYLKQTRQKTYYLDHVGLYCRIPGNFCAYHADNVYFHCPIHGDNQIILKTSCPGTCEGSGYLPNHTPNRTMTALIYLNQDFKGGQIVFEDGPFNKLYQKTFTIQKGMLLLAPNGPMFYHQVLPIISGKRYSLHLWYTD